MPAPPDKPAGRLLLVDGRQTFVPSTLAEVAGGEFPGGPQTDLPPPPKIGTGKRGRPAKTPSGTWEDDDLHVKVAAIVGNRRDREDESPDFAALTRLAYDVLGQKPTRRQEQRLRKLVFGGTTASGGYTRGDKASVITRELLAWRHGLTYPAVRDMQRRLRRPVTQIATALVLKYSKYDKDGNPDGPPLCNEDGRPIVWVPDEHGQPSRAYGVLDEHGQPRPYVAGEPLPVRPVKGVRPQVKMVFR